MADEKRMEFAVKLMMEHQINVIKWGDIELQKAHFPTSVPSKDISADLSEDEIARLEEELLFASGAQVRSLKG